MSLDDTGRLSQGSTQAIAICKHIGLNESETVTALAVAVGAAIVAGVTKGQARSLTPTELVAALDVEEAAVQVIRRVLAHDFDSVGDDGR